MKKTGNTAYPHVDRLCMAMKKLFTLSPIHPRTLLFKQFFYFFHLLLKLLVINQQF